MRLRGLAGRLLASASIGMVVSLEHAPARAQSLPPAGVLDIGQHPVGLARNLHLEVYLNGISTDLAAAFRQEADGSLAIAPEQLRNVGIAPPEAARRPDGLVALSQIPDISWEMDEATQTIHFTVGFDALATRVVEAQINDPEVPEAESGWGGLVNYTLFASTGGDGIDDMWEFEGVSGWFEGRIFSPLGVLSHSFIASSSQDESYDSKRLDTTWSLSSPRSMISYHLGDVITGGLSWTRPTRLGGIQVQRNFGLRPDLVTMPMPAVSGSAAVPSTVDVYINNTRRLSEHVPSGPFEITNLPVVTGSGTARVVVRDALGRETVSESPFFASSDLLAPGLWDFSLEGGFPRRFYGTLSNDYDDAFMAAGTVRRGVSNWLTVEAHAEGGSGLLNGGAGAAVGLWQFGVASFAGAASSYHNHTGYQVAASLEAEVRNLHLYGRTQRTFGDYLDIAAVSAEPPQSDLPEFGFLSAAPPRALDQVSLSVPLGFDPSTINLSYTHFETVEEERSRILGVSYSRATGSGASIFATAYRDLEDSEAFGVFAGLSMTLGGDIHGSLGISSDRDGSTVTADLVRSTSNEIGSVGWRLRAAEGARTSRHASINYRAPIARVEASLEQHEDRTHATAQIDGALVFAGNSLFLSNRINDAFAVVDAGAPGGSVHVPGEGSPIAFDFQARDGAATATHTFYATIAPSQQVARTGEYTAIFSEAEVRLVVHRYGLLRPTCSESGEAQPSAPLSVRATVMPNCRVTARNIDFGSHGVLDSAVDAAGGLDISCTAGTAYDVALNNGLNGTSPIDRQMTLGDEAVRYGLYMDPARTQPWGSVATQRLRGTGAGDPQSVPVYGRVPAQATPPPGTYTDTVVVTVTY